MIDFVNVIGGGLAGVEAAWQAAELGAKVRLFEMRPVQQTPAHRTDQLAEIVCSNSLKTDEPGSAPYLLKEELRRGGSMVLRAAEATKVPAGAALSVDRGKFSELITEWVEAHPNIEIVREEVTQIPKGEQDARPPVSVFRLSDRASYRYGTAKLEGPNRSSGSDFLDCC